MALLNNLYIFVETENVSNTIKSSTHPVETGIDITDSIRKTPVEISLSGKIVDTGSTKATDIEKKIKNLQNNGSLIKYSGSRNNIFSNLQIQSFQTDSTNEVWGGYNFSMTLKEVRIAKSAYKASANKKKTAAKTNTTKKIEKGSIVVFKGGNVYVSSDAKKAAAKRGRSTCKVEIPNSKSSPIRTESWAIHPYHLVSTDGGKVYGWVDKANIEGTSTNVKAKTSSGTQQVTNGSKKAVYHTVKKGECVYNLVTKNYKELGKSCQWVIDNNPSAFSKKGDPKTLKIGAKLLMGYK